MGFLRYRGARRCRGWMAFFPKDLERPCLISWWNDEWGDNISSPRAPEIPEIRNSKPSRRCFTKTIPDVSVWPHSLIQHICVASIFKKSTFGMRIPTDFLIFRCFFQRASVAIQDLFGTVVSELEQKSGRDPKVRRGRCLGFCFSIPLRWNQQPRNDPNYV